MFVDQSELLKVLVRALYIAFCGSFERIPCVSGSCNHDCDACSLREGCCTDCIHVDTSDCPYHVTRKELL